MKTIDNNNEVFCSLRWFAGRRITRWVILCLLTLPAMALSEGAPQIQGYGVKTCASYLTTYAGWEKGDDREILEYLRYQDWVSGLVTGLSLATAMDVLQGVEVKSVMRRVQIICEENPDEDFFTATTTLIKQLSSLQ